MPASSSTDSDPKIDAPVRSASAIASLGPRADFATVVEDEFGVEDVVAHLGDPDGAQLRAERGEHVAHQVVGQRARGDDALLCERDRGRLNGTDPDREVTLALDLAKQARSAGSSAARPERPPHAVRSR